MKTSALLFSIFILGCSNPGIKVQSDPIGADIIIASGGEAPRKIGQTPLTIDGETQSLSTEAVQITVAKEGYRTETVVLPSSRFRRAADVDVRLQEFKLPAACVKLDDALQGVARGVAETQSLIHTKNLDRAEQTLTQLIAKFSNVSVLYDLLGNVYYLRKDLDRALVAYRRSIELASDNLETTRMIKKIEEIRGVRQ